MEFNELIILLGQASDLTQGAGGSNAEGGWQSRPRRGANM